MNRPDALAPSARNPAMRSLAAQLCLTVVCLLFGVLLMMQFRTQSSIARSAVTDSSADQAEIIASLYDSNAKLRQEVADLNGQRLEYQRALAIPGTLAKLVSDVGRLRVVNGLTEVSGPGVELVILADVRPEDIQDLINEFRNAGAEALALNDQRIALWSSIRADRGGIALSGTHLDPPYVFTAIGAPETLERALTRKGGLVSYLQNTYPDATIRVEKRSALSLAPVAQGFQWQYAQPVE